MQYNKKENIFLPLSSEESKGSENGVTVWLKAPVLLMVQSCRNVTILHILQTLMKTYWKKMFLYEFLPEFVVQIDLFHNRRLCEAAL